MLLARRPCARTVAERGTGRANHSEAPHSSERAVSANGCNLTLSSVAQPSFRSFTTLFPFSFSVPVLVPIARTLRDSSSWEHEKCRFDPRKRGGSGDGGTMPGPAPDPEQGQGQGQGQGWAHHRTAITRAEWGASALAVLPVLALVSPLLLVLLLVQLLVVGREHP